MSQTEEMIRKLESPEAAEQLFVTYVEGYEEHREK